MNDNDKQGHFDLYSEYNKTLRAWFVGFGIGGPAIFITQEKVAGKIIASGHGVAIASFFLAGVAFQIGIALLNKWVNWRLYYHYTPPADKKKTRRLIVVEWLSNQFWIDMLCDLGSVAMFALATFKTMGVFI